MSIFSHSASFSKWGNQGQVRSSFDLAGAGDVNADGLDELFVAVTAYTGNQARDWALFVLPSLGASPWHNPSFHASMRS